MNEFLYDALSETHTVIDTDLLSEEQLYRRLSEGFDPLVIPDSAYKGR